MEVIKQTENKSGFGRIYKTDFKSIGSMVKYCKEAKTNKLVWPDEYDESSSSGGYHFTDTHSYKEAEDLLLNGWEDGSKKLTKSLKLANAKLQQKDVKRSINDIVGFQPNVPRYLQGIPTNMINKKNVKQNQKVITLTKSICYSAKVNKNDILEDSVKFLQIVQEIEKKGIRVNVYTIFHAIKDNEEILIRTKIKSSSERLNISKMSFPLLHPSFLRRIIFKVMEKEQRVVNGWKIGYGIPQGKHETKKLLDKNEYYIPVLISQNEALNIVENIK